RGAGGRAHATTTATRPSSTTAAVTVDRRSIVRHSSRELLLLLLCFRRDLFRRRRAPGAAHRYFREDRQVEGDDLFLKRAARAAAGLLGLDFRRECLLRVAPIDAAIRRDVVVVPAVSHDDVVLVRRDVVRRIE